MSFMESKMGTIHMTLEELTEIVTLLYREMEHDADKGPPGEKEPAHSEST